MAALSPDKVMRNLIRHQAAFYCIDGLGLVLDKLANAGKKAGHRILGCGGCANGRLLKSKRLSAHNGDLEGLKAKLIGGVRTDWKKLEKLPEDTSVDNQRQQLEEVKDAIMAAISNVDNGLGIHI